MIPSTSKLTVSEASVSVGVDTVLQESLLVVAPLVMLDALAVLRFRVFVSARVDAEAIEPVILAHP